MAEFHTYYSDRGIPLVYNGRPPRVPVLTVENYLKWYALYAIEPDGTAHPVHYTAYSHLEPVFDGVLWADHCLNPAAYDAIADKLKMLTDGNSRDMIAGRWVNDILDGRLAEL